MNAMSCELGDQANSYDVEVGGSEQVAVAVGDIDAVDALDFDAVFADDAGPGLHGVERAGGAGGVFDEEEGDGFAVRRPGGLVDVAGDVGQLLDSPVDFDQR